MASFHGRGGAVRRTWGIERRFTEIRSATAQARKPPNSSTSAKEPLASKCAKAQNFTAASMGCLAAALMRPGRYAARTKGKTGNMMRKVTWRNHVGGEYRTTGAWRAKPNP